MKKINLAEVQAHIILRGSKLSIGDKKRVLVESGAERAGSELEMKKFQLQSECSDPHSSRSTLLVRRRNR